MEWHDPDGVLQRGGGFPATRLGSHEALLVRADGFTLRGPGRQTGWSSHATERREECKWDFAQGQQHAAPLQARGTRGMPGAQILCYLHAWKVHERAGESADFRANVLHPGGTGWEVRAEAREVRG